MSTQHAAGVRLALAASWLALAAPPVHAQSTGSPDLGEQLAVQNGIYQLKGRDVPPGYIIDRSLFSYIDTLPPEFGAEIARLGPGDRWLDIGTGQGRAILDYYTPERDLDEAAEREWCEKRAAAVGISIEDRRTYRWHMTEKKLGGGKIRYLAGKRLREYRDGELGRFQVITDVGGGFTYTHELAQFTEKTLSLLAPGGTWYTVLQNVRAEDGKNEPYAGEPFLTQITRANGGEVRICAWLKSISCVKVDCRFRKEWDPPIEVYRVKKTCDQAKVPPLTPVTYNPGTPPERRFRLGETREARE